MSYGGIFDDENEPELIRDLMADQEFERDQVGHISIDEDSPEGMDLDDFFPETVEGIKTGVEPAAFSKTILWEGKQYLKTSIVASYLCSNRSKKVTMCTLRVRGISVNDLYKSKLDADQIDWDDLGDVDVLKAGDLAAILVRNGASGIHVCLAVMEVTGFKRGKGKDIVTSAVMRMDDLENSKLNIKVLGQLIELKMPPGTDFWEWTRKYIQLDLRARDKRLTHRQLVIEVPSVLIHPLAPTIAMQWSTDDINATQLMDTARLQVVNHPKLTWRLSAAEMSSAISFAWSSLDPNSEENIGHVAMLVRVENEDVLPYRDAEGKFKF